MDCLIPRVIPVCLIVLFDLHLRMKLHVIDFI